MAKMIDLNYNTFIIHGQKDGMKLHYASHGISKMLLG
jgi:hypothetical protein